MTDQIVLRVRFTAYDEWECPMCGHWHYVEDKNRRIYTHTCRLGVEYEPKTHQLPRVAFHAIPVEP